MRPDEALVFEALAQEHTSDPYWAAVAALQEPGDAATFALIVELASSPDVRTRALSIDVLGQFGFPEDRPFLEATLPVVERATDDAHEVVVVAALQSLGELHDPRALPTLLRFSARPSDEIRLAVTRALIWVDDSSPPAAIDALIELTRDRWYEIRDWATFELGSMTDVDTPQVRAALWARVADTEGDTAGEAILGLATRRDACITEELRQRLEDPNCGNLIVEAAAVLSDPVLLPTLQVLEVDGWAEDDAEAECLGPARSRRARVGDTRAH